MTRPILGFMLAETLLWAGLFYSFPVLVLHWQAEFGWPVARIMGALTCAIAAWALSLPGWGRLVDRGHGAAVMLGCGLAGAALLAALTLVSATWQFYALWAALGLAMGGALYETCFAIVTRAHGAAAQRPITAITLAAGFASTLAYPFVTWIAEPLGWRAAVLGLAAIVALIATPAAFLSARALQRGTTEAARAEAAGTPAPRGRLFWQIALAFAAVILASGIVMSHMFPIFAALGVAEGRGLLAASAIGPMQVAGRLVLMGAAGRLSGVATAAAGAAAVALAALCLLSAQGAPGLLLLFVLLFGMGYGVTGIMRPVVTRQVLGGAGFGATYGALVRPSLIAFAAAPALGAAIAAHGGYGLALALCAVLALTGAVLLWAAGRAR